MAGKTYALSQSFHADLFELAESNGALGWPEHAASYATRILQNVRQLITSIERYVPGYNQHNR